MRKKAKVTHTRNLVGLVLGVALVGCNMGDTELTESDRTTVRSGQAIILDQVTPGQGTLAESREPIGPSVVDVHHHHLRGSNCGHGVWATTDNAGHHHHKRGSNCKHGVWATSSADGHHHHKRGDDCPAHGQWATSDPFNGITAAVFSDDPSVPYDLSQSDQRPYDEVEAELAHPSSHDSAGRHSQSSTQP